MRYKLPFGKEHDELKADNSMSDDEFLEQLKSLYIKHYGPHGEKCFESYKQSEWALSSQREEERQLELRRKKLAVK